LTALIRSAPRAASTLACALGALLLRLQIWDLASGGGPALNQLQFNASMRLVALAQVGFLWQRTAQP
jgi:hypothetical protein